MSERPDDLASAEITLATVREHAERAVDLTRTAPPGSHAAGCRQMAREVLAILDKRYAPAGEPVIMPSPWDQS